MPPEEKQPTPNTSEGVKLVTKMSSFLTKPDDEPNSLISTSQLSKSLQFLEAQVGGLIHSKPKSDYMEQFKNRNQERVAKLDSKLSKSDLTISATLYEAESKTSNNSMSDPHRDEKPRLKEIDPFAEETRRYKEAIKQNRNSLMEQNYKGDYMKIKFGPVVHSRQPSNRTRQISGN
jgi:hypothetical protein